jgi:DNA-binding CsgD family transcriptional regulator
LSRCQLDTLRHITLGRANQQIANVMHRSKRAVEWHIRHIHRLLGASARESLARLGRHAGLDAFRESEWTAVLGTRPARRTLEAFDRDGSPRVA